jgi:N-acetylneuraminic acid mutarotase
MRKYLIPMISIYFMIFLSCSLFNRPEKFPEDNNRNSGSSINSVNTNAEGSNQWTWISGSNMGNQKGIYGSIGVPDASNMPGARSSSISWIDSKDNFWFFGGWGYDANGNLGYLNDLWKFDGKNWIWISGSNIYNQKGIYGSIGVTDIANIPGARGSGAGWIDKNNNLWLFGGSGYDASGNAGNLNDLWEFDGANWRWISGSSFKGTPGVSNDTHIPGASSYSASAVDSLGNFFLFGGMGNDYLGNSGNLNDLWNYDGAKWNCLSGNLAISPYAMYGQKNVTVNSNIPGSRINALSWADKNNNFLLFGGCGYDSNNNFGFLNDLWKFDGKYWTWISGSSLRNQNGIYGSKGVADILNVPGSRNEGVSWIDKNGILWLFGGEGIDIAGVDEILNDLWKFDGSNWTWVSGNNQVMQIGFYGAKSVPASSNVPGARSNSVSWIDSSGNLWLFGGIGSDGAGNRSYLNDLWKYKP